MDSSRFSAGSGNQTDSASYSMVASLADDQVKSFYFPIPFSTNIGERGNYRTVGNIGQADILRTGEN